MPTVSIYVPTFNHENYITQALDSIKMQKTEYSFEVLVGEDCSTDNTRQVLKAWQAANPDERFRIFYRQENMHRKPVNNAGDLKARCQGKYIICLEGDDFWTDENKLQKQVSFLENHPEYYAVAHNCTVVGADGAPNGEEYPQCKDTEYTLRHYASNILPGQYTTLLSRNYMKDSAFDSSLLQARIAPGDRQLYFSVLCFSRIYCMQQTMSAYRHVTSGGSSYSATASYRYENEERFYRAQMDYAARIGHKKALKYVQMLYLRNIRNALLRKQIPLSAACKDMKNLQNKLRAAALLFKRDVLRCVLRKSVQV